MSKSLFGLVITALVLSIASVSGQELGTVEQARAMLDRAINALKSNEATALSEFNDPNNKQFHERDLYVFCFDMSDGKIKAYESPALLNVDVRTLALKDDPIGKRAYEAVQNASEGSIVTIDYKFPKPVRPSRFQNKLSRRGSAIKAAWLHTTNRRRHVVPHAQEEHGGPWKFVASRPRVCAIRRLFRRPDFPEKEACLSAIFSAHWQQV
jgi:hypothetical protein